MKNSKIRGRWKHPKAQAFERDFLCQVKPEHRKELGRLGKKPRWVRANLRVFYPSRRQDLDTDLVYDCLQRGKVLLNDKVVREKHEYGFVDKKNPRVEIELEEIYSLQELLEA